MRSPQHSSLAGVVVLLATSVCATAQAPAPPAPSHVNRVQITNVQQIRDQAFYRRGDRWLDSRIVNRGDALQPDRVVEFGSAEYRTIADRLAADGRAGSLGLGGDVLIPIDGAIVLLKAPPSDGASASQPVQP